MPNAHRLGASLYVPANHRDLPDIADGRKWPELRSVIFCTEDAIAPGALEHALRNLGDCLRQMSSACRLLRFVRVRNPDILERILSMPGVDKLDGFVFPKVDRRTVDRYMAPVQGTPYLTMPTLETRDAFDARKMAAFRDHLLEQGFEKRILALRIGGNDLLSILGIRRPRDMTVYRTPLGHTIAQIVTVFKPYGFELTAPVFEHIDCPEILQAEVREDIAHGLCGKTAIHPSQIPLIEAGYRISPGDLEAARRILQSDRAVFNFGGSMCEVATHSAWARHVIERSDAYS
ncbi:HpcH/HpaI aldolase/citrate lyase family protein [Methylocaldum sp. MU1018]